MNLIQLIKSDEARKIFGKREIKIIEKQLLGINLSQSEKNRLSRDIRKKLEFIKKVAKFEDDFKLKKGTIVKKIIADTKNIIQKDLQMMKIEKIIIFGSVVDNKLSFRSDVDIAVVFDEISSKDATLFRRRILSKVSERVDIQVYNLLPKNVREEIDRKGRIIYEKGR